LPKYRLRAFICSLFAPILFSGCTEKTAEPVKIEPPTDWQAQLKPANLPSDFVPAVTERVYVPIYSDIYYEDNHSKLPLEGTLSIRNTDATHSMILKSIRYYGSSGNLIQSLLDHAVTLGPFATADVVVPRTHEAGGSGANFVVDWVSAKKISEPLVEAVMVSIGSPQSVSFVSRGVVTEHSETTPSTTHQQKAQQKQ
jgi:Protein of unknown function (DUF3124)